MGNGNADAITVERVSKAYRVAARQQALAQMLLLRMLGVRRPIHETWALEDVSFSVPQGKSLGVIGANGAGKSTLLKIIAGIAVPTSGTVRVRGAVSTQLALGAGFHPYLSGRENVFLQGSVLGMSNARIREIFPTIVEFAGLDGAIDRPLWTYSSGMTARLGFAVAAHVDFELLLLDEALSAGDLNFRERCEQTLRNFRAAGMTLVIVSHGLRSILELCDHAIWLEKGRVREQGPAREVADHYALAHTGKPAESAPEGNGERATSRLSL
jgi:ABC-type polysaccharide/polyol phosphate transport system ATPase subunit